MRECDDQVKSGLPQNNQKKRNSILLISWYCLRVKPLEYLDPPVQVQEPLSFLADGLKPCRRFTFSGARGELSLSIQTTNSLTCIASAAARC